MSTILIQTLVTPRFGAIDREDRDEVGMCARNDVCVVGIESQHRRVLLLNNEQTDANNSALLQVV